MMPPSDAELRSYGYIPGDSTRWCAACGKEVAGLGARAFKCRRCAVVQWREVEKCCRRAGLQEASS